MTDEENWYVLEVDDIDDKVRRFGGLGIPFNKVGDSDIAFPSSFSDQVLKEVGKKGVPYLLKPTGRPNTFIITLHDGDLDKPPGENFEGWEYLIPVINEVYNVFGVRILPDNPHGKTKEPVPTSNEDFLHVNFWSAPGKAKKVKMARAFGIPLSSRQMDALTPTHVGIAIKDEDGAIIAEYVSNNLYILFDLPHGEGDNVTELFARIMKAYFAARGKTESDLVNFYQSVRGMTSISSRDQFVKSCSKLYEKNLKTMEESLKSYDSTINEYNLKLVGTMRDREILLIKLEPLQASVNSRREWANTEYDTLCASPHIKDVVVVGKTIHVFTDNISINYKDQNYNLGEFRVDIFTDGDKAGVKAFNITKPMHNLCHPHVKGSGECCLGNISSGVTKLLAEYQYVVLAQLMITYLQSYNPESAYGSVTLWGAD